MRRLWAMAGLVVSLRSGAAVPAAPVSEEWDARRANVRFHVEVTRRPTVPEAGVLVFIPDMGVLPEPFARATVVSGKGEELDSRFVWFSPGHGAGLVFAEPGPRQGRDVTVYLEESRQLARWEPDSPLRPSLLLFTSQRPGGPLGLADAQRLAAGFPPTGPGVEAGPVPIINHSYNPFGPSDWYLSYYRGYVNAPQAGRYWFATISDDDSECRIDGQMVASWPGMHTRAAGARGQYGNWLNLASGLHLVEYLHVERTGDQEAHLVWRTPDMAADALPVTVPRPAFAHSGVAEIRRVATKGDALLAAAAVQPVSYTCVGEHVLSLMHFQAQWSEANPADTTYRWGLPGKVRVTGREVDWLLAATGETAVRLEASWRTRRASTEVRVPFEETQPRADLQDRATRERYRQAVLNVAKAVAAEPAAAAAIWDADFWALLAFTVDTFEDALALDDVLDLLRPGVAAPGAGTRWELEDLYWEALRRRDPKRAGTWLSRRSQDETAPGRQYELDLAMVEHLAIDRHDPAAARQALLRLGPPPATAGWATAVRYLVRQADVARLAGEVEAARQGYAAAAERYRTTGGAATGAGGDWRSAVVRAPYCDEAFQACLKDNRPFEARTVLRRWELEFPLEKIGGPLPLAEARYCAAAGDLGTAIWLLERYRAVTEVSNYLADAMALELEWRIRGQDLDAAADLAREAAKRFPDHPVAAAANRFLANRRRDK